jgi:ABC-type sugar transport system ATPase subunit
MNMLGRVDPPTSGTVRFDSADVATLSDDALTDFRGHHFGFVFQSFNPMPVLSAVDNVTLTLQIQGMDKAEAVARASRHPGQRAPDQKRKTRSARPLRADVARASGNAGGQPRLRAFFPANVGRNHHRWQACRNTETLTRACPA